MLRRITSKLTRGVGHQAMQQRGQATNNNDSRFSLSVFNKSNLQAGNETSRTRLKIGNSNQLDLQKFIS